MAPIRMTAGLAPQAQATQGQQPANWPFPPLAPMQARNHQRCVAELDAMAHRRRQQALRECLRAWQEQVGEALL